MKELNELVTNKLSKMYEDGIIDTIIEEKLSKMIESIYEDIFSSYGEVAKELKYTIIKEMKIHVRKIGLADYNKSLINIFKKELQNKVSLAGIDKFEKSVKKMLDIEVPETMKMTDLMNKFKENLMEDGNEYGDITFIHNCQNGEKGPYWIYFDECSDVDKYKCKYNIMIGCANDVSIFEINGKECDTTSRFGGLYGFDALLFKLYSVGTVIENDCEDVTYEYGDY